MSQTLERRNQLTVNVIHIGIGSLGISYQRLKSGILIEHQETVTDVGIGNGTKLQHLLYQGTGLYRIVGIHLLERREITGSQITALQTVIALHRQWCTVNLIIRLKLIFTSRMKKHNC